MTSDTAESYHFIKNITDVPMRFAESFLSKAPMTWLFRFLG